MAGSGGGELSLMCGSPYLLPKYSAAEVSSPMETRRPKIHDGARPGIEARGRELLGRIREDTEPQPSKPEFQSERPVAAFTEKDIIGQPRMWRTNIAGRKLAALFWRDNTAFGLFDADYQELRGLVELVLKSPWMRERISADFLEDTIFDWCGSNYQSETITSLCDHVVSECSKAIARFSVWVPVANLETEVVFSFGPVRIDRIRKLKLDRMRDRMLRKSPDQADAVEAMFEEFRKEMQGLAAVVVDIEAEHRHAFAVAIEQADAAIGLLRIFHSPAALIPWCTCAAAILGSESIPEGTALFFKERDQLSHRESTVLFHGTRALDWQLTGAVHEDMCRRHLAEAGKLVKADGLTEFQQALRSSLLTYSKGLTLPDINDRLVHTLSALEGLLLKDSSEPIQQSLADRMAFALFSDPQSRMDAARNLKAVYGMRSRYIHHRVSLTDERELETFVLHASLFFEGLLRSAPHYNSRAEFITAIEKRKYGH